MSQRVKVLISALVVALLITAGATAVVMAQEEPPSETQGHSLLSRVAAILGIPDGEMASAFKQARHEMREEAFDRTLARAVEGGRITPDEAVEIKQWLEQRSEALDPVLRRLVHRIKTHLQTPRVQARIKRLVLGRTAEILDIPGEELVAAFKQVRQEMHEEALTRALARAVEEGRITPDEAVEIKQWLEQRPEALDQLGPHIRHALTE
jgi:hypothetical protein